MPTADPNAKSIDYMYGDVKSRRPLPPGTGSDFTYTGHGGARRPAPARARSIDTRSPGCKSRRAANRPRHAAVRRAGWRRAGRGATALLLSTLCCSSGCGWLYCPVAAVRPGAAADSPAAQTLATSAQTMDVDP